MKTSAFVFADDSGLLIWKASDRAVVTIGGVAQWAAHRDAIVALVPRWMKAVAEQG